MISTKQTQSIKKEILHTLITLSIPTILEEVLATLLQYVDTAMVGHLGEQATAAVSVTTTVTWLVNSVPSAISVAVLAMVSKAIGSHNEELVQRISKQVLLLVVGCGLITGVVSLALSSYIPIWMGAEEAVQETASIYFFIISLPMLFRASSAIFGATIRATQNTRTPMLVSMGANVVNVILNVVLIYIWDLGVIGAAIASAISYTFSGLLMFIAYRRNQMLHWSFQSFCVDSSLLKECAKISFPVLGSGMISCLGYVVFAGLVSGMGTTIFAAHSIAVTAETIFYIPGYGLRTATSTLVGVSLGEGDKNKFETVGYLSVFLTVGMMCFNGVLLYLISHPLMSLFTKSQDAILIGAEMLKLVAFSEPFFGLMIVLEGIFYGLGRTRYAFAIETFSMWGIRILFTFLCVQVWNLDLRAVWYCMIADNVCKALLFTLPVITKKGRERLFVS